MNDYIESNLIPMSKIEEYVLNRLAQAKSVESEVQLRRWRFLNCYLRVWGQSPDEKKQFIRDSLESFKVSETTIDIMVRKMIRMTLPGWVSYEFLSRPEVMPQPFKVNHSTTTPGLSYKTTLGGCDCPGNRSHEHCKHHDAFLEEMSTPTVEIIEKVVVEDDYRATAGIGNATPDNLLHIKVVD